MLPLFAALKWLQLHNTPLHHRRVEPCEIPPPSHHPPLPSSPPPVQVGDHVKLINAPPFFPPLLPFPPSGRRPCEADQRAACRRVGHAAAHAQQRPLRRPLGPLKGGDPGLLKVRGGGWGRKEEDGGGDPGLLKVGGGGRGRKEEDGGGGHGLLKVGWGEGGGGRRSMGEEITVFSR